MNYRREIDGLRAVAVLPVILFHGGFETFRGGFVGVDIFFVISGYLITSIILADHHAGNFSLVRFYERRARRILPALFFIVIASIPFAWWWMLPSDLKAFSRSVAAVSVFGSNILFWQESGYFDISGELKPLLHTWSLAVEEQYYVLFPLLVMLLWRWGKLRLAWVLGIVGIASLALGEWAAIHKPTAAFFLLPTRGWELLIGALTALFLFRRDTSPGARPGNAALAQAGSLVGILLILYAIFVFDKSTRVPGFASLVPTLGAAAIILFAAPVNLVGKLLGSKALVGIGLISYSAYLWHQPLFAFARLRSLNEPGKGLMLLLAASAIVLAVITWRYVERPFRDKNKTSRKTVFSLSVVFSVALFACGTIGYLKDGFEGRIDLPSALTSEKTFGQLRKQCDLASGIDIAKDPFHRTFCVVGNLDVPPTVAVVGDSHSTALLRAFDAAGKQAGVAIAQNALDGCPHLLPVYVLKGNDNAEMCHGFNERIFEYVKKNNIRKIFLVSRWTLYTNAGRKGRGIFGGIYNLGLSKDDGLGETASRRAFEKGLEETIKTYADAGVRVYIVNQVPQQLNIPEKIYSTVLLTTGKLDNETLRKLSVGVAEHQAMQSYVSGVFGKIAANHSAAVVSFDAALCDAEYCPVGNEHESFYLDADHLSDAGSLPLAPQLKAFLMD